MPFGCVSWGSDTDCLGHFGLVHPSLSCVRLPFNRTWFKETQTEQRTWRLLPQCLCLGVSSCSLTQLPWRGYQEVLVPIQCHQKVSLKALMEWLFRAWSGDWKVESETGWERLLAWWYAVILIWLSHSQKMYFPKSQTNSFNIIHYVYVIKGDCILARSLYLPKKCNK